MSEISKSRIIVNWFQEAGWILYILLISPLNFFLRRLHKPGRRKETVVIVCDFFTNPLVYLRLAGRLQKAGFPVHTVTTGTIFKDLRQHARQLGQYLESENLRNVVLIGHGIGSLAALSLPDASRQRIHHLMALATPFNGTRLMLPLRFIPGLGDMSVGSEYLLLNRMNSLLFALFTPCCAWEDEMIIPFNLSRFGQGRDLIFDRAGHFNLVLSGENLDTLTEILTETYPDPTTAVEKARLEGVAQSSTTTSKTTSPASSTSRKKATSNAGSKAGSKRKTTSNSTGNVRKKTGKKK